VLVLVLVTVVALVLGALLSFTDTSVRATVNLRDQGASAYEADGALQAAVNNIRNSNFSGASGQHCFGSTDTLSLPNFNGADSAAVSCTADPSKVLIQCPSLSQCNRPGSAILTLGTSSEDGVHIEQPTGSTFRVHGVVFSNSNLNVVNGALNTNTAVYARGACSGTVQASPAAKCNYGGAANPLGNDPGYAPALTTVPAHRALPACTTPNSVVTFQPGYYDDAAGLTAMMAGNSSCKHSTWWFTPGAYYFDFHNGGTNANPLLGSGSDLWTIDDGYLVAGTPVDTSGRVVSTPSVPAHIPGSCDNPIEDAHAVGVQFVFGGDSQLAVKSGQAEICGSYSANTPPVALYGLTSGAETSTSLAGATALKPAGVTSPGAFTNATPAVLSTVDGSSATWVNNGNGNQSTTLTVNGYAPPSVPPAGSVLTAARLRVVHGNTAGSAQDNLSAQLTPTGGAAVNVPVPSYGDNVLHTDLIDVYQGGTGSLAQLVYNGTFTGAQLSYSAAVKHKGTEQLDAVQLELTYTAPALRAQGGCTTSVPYGSGGSCPTVSTINNSGNQFYIQGTTYAPKGVLDVTLNNAAEQIFRFGVVARSLWVKETGSFSYSGVVIEVPDDSPGFVFGVYLTAYVCPSSSTCAPGGTPAARARVAYVDGDPTNPVPGARQVSVLSWSGSR
jgi:Tfp pilus assembly protein PilX